MSNFEHDGSLRRNAAWEAKWQDMEADLDDALCEERGIGTQELALRMTALAVTPDSSSAAAPALGGPAQHENQRRPLAPGAANAGGTRRSAWAARRIGRSAEPTPVSLASPGRHLDGPALGKVGGGSGLISSGSSNDGSIEKSARAVFSEAPVCVNNASELSARTRQGTLAQAIDAVVLSARSVSSSVPMATLYGHPVDSAKEDASGAAAPEDSRAADSNGMAAVPGSSRSARCDSEALAAAMPELRRGDERALPEEDGVKSAQDTNSTEPPLSMTIAVEEPALNFDDVLACDDEASQDTTPSSIDLATPPEDQAMLKDCVDSPPSKTTWRGIPCIWRTWCTMVCTSVVEFGLLVGSSLADNYYSPCRSPLGECGSLPPDECSGRSCQESVPFWAPAWPLSGLFCLALPAWFVIRGKCHDCHALWLKLALLASLAMIGAGAALMVDVSISGVHFAGRCPMERANDRCSPELCPIPVCKRENEFSPCVCGHLGEAELARVLFLRRLPACQPYEWYSRQMVWFEELVLEYESFACLLGVLNWAAAGVGMILLLLQFLFCPLLLLGSWGGARLALLVLLGSDDELDEALGVMLPPALPADPEMGKDHELNAAPTVGRP